MSVVTYTDDNWMVSFEPVREMMWRVARGGPGAYVRRQTQLWKNQMMNENTLLEQVGNCSWKQSVCGNWVDIFLVVRLTERCGIFLQNTNEFFRAAIARVQKSTMTYSVWWQRKEFLALVILACNLSMYKLFRIDIISSEFSLNLKTTFFSQNGATSVFRSS